MFGHRDSKLDLLFRFSNAERLRKFSHEIVDGLTKLGQNMLKHEIPLYQWLFNHYHLNLQIIVHKPSLTTPLPLNLSYFAPANPQCSPSPRPLNMSSQTRSKRNTFIAKVISPPIIFLVTNMPRVTRCKAGRCLKRCFAMENCILGTIST